MTAHIPSTWRDPIGPLLTNRRISFYQLEGRYGPEAQAVAQHYATAAQRVAQMKERTRQRRAKEAKLEARFHERVYKEYV